MLYINILQFLKSTRPKWIWLDVVLKSKVPLHPKVLFEFEGMPYFLGLNLLINYFLGFRLIARTRISRISSEVGSCFVSVIMGWVFKGLRSKVNALLLFSCTVLTIFPFSHRGRIGKGAGRRGGILSLSKFLTKLYNDIKWHKAPLWGTSLRNLATTKFLVFIILYNFCMI